MKKIVFFSVIFSLVLCLIDTAIISHISFLKFRPALVLLLVIFVAAYNGSLAGTIAGFFAGLILDFLSLAPLGLHSAIFVIISFTVGKLHGQYNLSRIFVPAVLAFLACIAQSLLLYLFRFIFGSNIIVPGYQTIDFWIGLALTVVCAPLMFAVFNLFPSLLKTRDIL